MTTLQVKDVKFIFDLATVESALDKYERRVLSRTGAFGRRVMRNSIRKAPKNKQFKTSPPFPRYRGHRNSGLRLILFEYEPGGGSVVIGPLKFRSSRRRQWHNRVEEFNTGSRTVPELLNESGSMRVMLQYRSGHVYSKTYRYRRFPFRDIAMEKTLDKMKEIIANEKLKA